MYQAGWALLCCDNKQSQNVSKHNKLILTHATGPVQVDGVGEGGEGALFISHPGPQAATALSPRVLTQHRGRKRDCSEMGTDSKLKTGPTCVTSTHISSVRESYEHPVSKGAGKNNPTACLEERGGPQDL